MWLHSTNPATPLIQVQPANWGIGTNFWYTPCRCMHLNLILCFTVSIDVIAQHQPRNTVATSATRKLRHWNQLLMYALPLYASEPSLRFHREHRCDCTASTPHHFCHKCNPQTEALEPTFYVRPAAVCIWTEFYDFPVTIVLCKR